MKFDLSTLLTAVAGLILFGSFYAVFTGGHASRTKDGRVSTFDFDSSPVRYSLTIGMYFAVGMTLLYFANDALLLKGASMLPEFIKPYLVKLLTMKPAYMGGGALFAICITVFGMFAFLMRKFVVTGATYGKGLDMDMDKRTVNAWEKKQEKERNAER